jgi:XTP/dITP diphosphohydrolase
MDNRILVGTFNPGKAAEISAWLRKEGFETVVLSELDLDDIEETGQTFEENAVLKAVHFAAITGLVTLADDSGFEVDALGGLPGVKSRRWIGEDASWEDLARAIIDRMSQVPPHERTARLRTVMALATPDGGCKTVEASIEGDVPMTLDETLITAGYPYRALLVVKEFGKLYANLNETEHDQVNQRRKALRSILSHLKSSQH